MLSADFAATGPPTGCESSRMEKPILYVKRGCPYCKNAKDYLDQRQIAYREVEVRSAPAEMKKLEEVSGQSKTPTLVWEGDVLADFGTDQLEEFLASRSPEKS